jgi:hypothetical protein
MANRMKSFIFIYQSGPDPIPAERTQEHRQAWRTWSINLREKYGIHTAGGKVISCAARLVRRGQASSPRSPTSLRAPGLPPQGRTPAKDPPRASVITPLTGRRRPPTPRRDDASGKAKR